MCSHSPLPFCQIAIIRVFDSTDEADSLQFPSSLVKQHRKAADSFPNIISYSPLDSFLNMQPLKKSKQKNPMYPKVKVREETNQDDAVDHAIYDSLYMNMHVSSSPEIVHQHDSPPFIARIPKSYVPNIATISTYQETDRKIDDTDRCRRPISILRPRAVLSSPDNDAVIGKKNTIKAAQPTALRDRSVVQNRHTNAHCTVNSSPITTKAQINTKLSNKVTDTKSALKGKKGSATAVPSQKKKTVSWEI